MDESLALLRKVAAAVGVTPYASVTVGQLFRQYKATRPHDRRWQLERNLLRPFVVAFWRRDVKTIDTSDWIAHRRRRQKEPTRTGRPPSPLTVNLELTATKRLLRFGGVRLDAKRAKARERRESWFTADQINQLIDGAEALRWRRQRSTFAALVAVMADTGLRISEALSLRWDRITLRGTTSVIGKGSKPRVVAFTPRAMKLLAALERHPSGTAVFLHWRTGRAYDPSTIRAWFRRAVRAAGLEGVKVEGDLALVPHNLRHSAASIADERGAPATWIQAMLGHAHLSTTMKYLHRDQDDHALRMAAIMAGRKPPRRAASPKLISMKKEIASSGARGVQN